MSFHHPSHAGAPGRGDCRPLGRAAAVRTGRRLAGSRAHRYSSRLGAMPERVARFRESVAHHGPLAPLRRAAHVRGQASCTRRWLLPRPQQHVPIVIGGSGRAGHVAHGRAGTRTSGTVAALAEDFRGAERVSGWAARQGRRPRSSVRRSMMLFLRFGREQASWTRDLAERPFRVPARGHARRPRQSASESASLRSRPRASSASSSTGATTMTTWKA